MNKYDPNIHHRRSIRLKGYDYSQAGAYFITICCQNRAHLFGKIVSSNDGNPPKMILNEIGLIAYNAWLKTPEIRNNVELDVFVIMPNHIHGIIFIRGGELNSPNIDKGELHLSDKNIKAEYKSTFQSPSNNVGAIVRGYKSSVTKQIHIINQNVDVWQRNYYENIIKSEQAYQNISNYIINNPTKWHEDKFYV